MNVTAECKGTNRKLDREGCTQNRQRILYNFTLRL